VAVAIKFGSDDKTASPSSTSTGTAKKVTLKAPDKIGALKKAADQSRAQKLNSALTNAGLENPYAAVYEDTKNPGRTVAIHPSGIQGPEDCCLQSVSHSGHGPIFAGGKRLRCQFGRFSQANDSRYVLRSGAARALVAPAVKQGLEFGAFSDIERTNSLWGVEFMSGNRKQVAADRLHINPNLRRRLHSIGVEVDIGFGADFPKLLDRLDHARLVVRVHDRDQLGVRPDRPAYVIGIHQASSVHRNKRDFSVTFGELLAGIQDGVMLNGRGNNMIARANQPEDGEVVSLSSTAGENHFSRAATKQGRHRFPGPLDRGTRLLTMMVDGRSVAKVLRKVGAHCIQHFG